MAQEILRILKPDGTADKARVPELPDAKLRQMYTTMVRARMVNERGMLLQRQGRIGFYIGAEGQEAIPAGVAAALQEKDWYFPHYRDLAVALARGAPINAMVHNLYGTAKDEAKGRQMPNHFSFRDVNFFSISSPLTTQVPQAVGAAYAMKLAGKGEVAATGFGDGSTSQGDFHVGLNFAAVWKCPVVFICNNNGYAISVPLEKQTASESIAIKAVAYGMPGIRVDGNDVLAVYAAVHEAAERARRGEGPTLIEAVTFRMGPHSSSDDPKRYVPQELYTEWAQKDPIARFRTYLEKRGIWSERDEQELIEATKAELLAAVEEVEATPPPAFETLFTDVFKEPTPTLLKQMAELKESAGEH
ncbi:MAG TPA: pyruvate dehydrogenase (acetyl-transferring) E1 component subunit alpha [Candidatus Thermoplasmatota archaeon]|nr:pyruvate dehydrogenase (acetyl-transferring) E1 component subunit alpha [Candidatus Thermoplasmatota archaeon]